MTQTPKNIIFCLTLLSLILSSSINAQEVRDSKQINVSLTLIADEPVPQEWKEKFAFPDNYFITFESDFDGDDISDYLEYYADTNPIDGSSRLKITSAEVDEDNLIIKWSSSGNKVPAPREYIIFRAETEYLSALANASSIEELQNNPNIVQVGPLSAAESPDEMTTYTENGVETSISYYYRVFLSKPLPFE